MKPGENVAVIGIGGIGAAAVQGAKIAGARNIIAIDPVEFKRDEAMKRFGASPRRREYCRCHRGDHRGDLGSDVRRDHLCHGRRRR